MTAPTRENAPARTAAELRADLAAEREMDMVWREDSRARRAGVVEHRDAIAEVEETAAAAKRARRERSTDAREAEKLNALYRRATRSGERARLRARIMGSAEVRALRVAKVRTVTLAVGIPVLLAFAAWSTTGVQAGVVRLLDLNAGSAAWWAAWIVEPAAIAVVAGIIVGRAILRSSGGNTDWRSAVAECAFLGGSLLLNIFGGWPAGSGWDGFTTALPHAIGPAGAAATAWLIGLFDGYVSDARPWDGAPRLADLTPERPVSTDPGQGWFWTPEWQAGERAASEQIAAGDTQTYDSMDALLADDDAPAPVAADQSPRVAPAANDTSVPVPAAPVTVPEPLPAVETVALFPSWNRGADLDVRPALVTAPAPLFMVPDGPGLGPHDTPDTDPFTTAAEAAEDSADDSDVSSELLAIGRLIAAELALDGLPLTRANLLDALRQHGRRVSNGRASELLRQLKPAA